ncbi:MAG: RecQ family ATP-dependent DNA helicase [Marmoricola sp.]
MTEQRTAAKPHEWPDVRIDAERHLRALVGSPDARLHDDQWDAIEALAVHKRRALVVQRTGWGKSAVYFVATALLREAGAGPTVIISPLLALMRNQIEAADRAGIHAVTINSTNIEQWDQINARINSGEVDVLLVSPERLNNPGFRDQVLPRLTETAGLLVSDEAHCISDWGHDFRPDYRRIKQMLTDLPPGIPVLATTATANARVTTDVAEQLGGDQVLVQRGSLDRESLSLAVLQLPSAEQRLGWLADHLGDLDGSGIIYCLTVAQTQEIADYLRERGHHVAAYSGQTESGERLVLEQDLATGRVKALVATSALGMGFDATLGFVVNVGAPASPISYYQQVGRAGRGTDHAAVVLLPAREDREVWAYFASLAFPSEGQVRRTLEVLAEEGRPVSTATLETYVDLNRNRLETMLKVLDVDGAVRRVQGGWTSTGRPWTYDADRYARVAEARRDEQAAMLGYIATEACRMRFLRDQLDDPAGEDCGRCDNCGGFSPDPTVSEAAAEDAGTRLARPGVTLSPRKMWPTALVNLGLDLRGKISSGEAAEPGRAVARMTDLGLGQDLRDLFRSGVPDQPVPDRLVAGVLEVLRSWEGLPRPDGIVAFESSTRPELNASFADGLSRFLGVPVLGRMRIVDEGVAPGQGAVNSAQRVNAVTRRYRLETDDVAERQVLLVDDRSVSGWSMTIAARLLRQAGAVAVHPLVLGTS